MCVKVERERVCEGAEKKFSRVVGFSVDFLWKVKEGGSQRRSKEGRKRVKKIPEEFLYR